MMIDFALTTLKERDLRDLGILNNFLLFNPKKYTACSL